MLSIAKAFQFDVIAQGVESSNQESFLKRTNCDLVQGFLYSEPVSKEVAEKLLEIMKNGGKLEDAIWLS